MTTNDRGTPRYSPTTVVRLVQAALDGRGTPTKMDYARAARAAVGAAQLLRGLGVEPWTDPADPPDRLADREAVPRVHHPATLANRGAIPSFDPAQVVHLVRDTLEDLAVPVLLDDERAELGARELLRAIGVAPWKDPVDHR